MKTCAEYVPKWHGVNRLRWVKFCRICHALIDSLSIAVDLGIEAHRCECDDGAVGDDTNLVPRHYAERREPLSVQADTRHNGVLSAMNLSPFPMQTGNG